MSDDRRKKLIAALLQALGVGFEAYQRGKQYEDEQERRERDDERSQGWLDLQRQSVEGARAEREAARQAAERETASRSNLADIGFAQDVAAEGIEDPSSLRVTPERALAARGPRGVAASTIPLVTERGAVTPGSLDLQTVLSNLRPEGEMGRLGEAVPRVASRAGALARASERSFERGTERGIGRAVAEHEAMTPLEREDFLWQQAHTARAGDGGGAAEGVDRVQAAQAEGLAKSLAARGMSAPQIAQQLISRFQGIPPEILLGIAVDAEREQIGFGAEQASNPAYTPPVPPQSRQMTVGGGSTARRMLGQ